MKVEYPLLALSSGVNRLSTKAVLTINRHNSRISWQLASKYPEEYEGRKIVPTPGKSILPIVRGEEMPDRYIYAEHEGNRMVRKGDWKLVSANFRGDEWELYNIKEDRTEQHNLIKEYPEMAKELEDAYFEWADHSDVLYFPKVWNTYNKGRRKDFKEYRDK